MRVNSHLASPCTGCLPVLQVPTAADAMTKRQTRANLFTCSGYTFQFCDWLICNRFPPPGYVPPLSPVSNTRGVAVIQDGRPPAEDKLLRELQQPREDGYIFQIRSFLWSLAAEGTGRLVRVPWGLIKCSHQWLTAAILNEMAKSGRHRDCYEQPW